MRRRQPFRRRRPHDLHRARSSAPSRGTGGPLALLPRRLCAARAVDAHGHPERPRGSPGERRIASQGSSTLREAILRFAQDDVGTVLTPRRRRGVELLDDPNIDPAVASDRSATSRAPTAGSADLRAASIELRARAPRPRPPRPLLDVGTGLGDIPACVADDAARGGRRRRSASTKRRRCCAAARGSHDVGVCANALALALSRSQHRRRDVLAGPASFRGSRCRASVREMNRVARRRRHRERSRRSWIAAAGFWLVSFPMRFHRVTRHDGTVSVLRGFTASELGTIVRSATGVTPRVQRRLGYRLTARWSPLGCRMTRAVRRSARCPPTPMTTVDEQSSRRIARGRSSRSPRTSSDGRRSSRTIDTCDFIERRADGGGLVEMSANRPFGPLHWPTWWTSLMSVRGRGSGPRRRRSGSRTSRRHDGHGGRVDLHAGRGGDARAHRACLERTAWPLIGASRRAIVIGPVFVHGIASRTLAGLARAAERSATDATHASRCRVAERRRVAITGIGAVTPIGISRDGLWDGLRAQRSAVRRSRASTRRCSAATTRPRYDFEPTDFLEAQARASGSTASASSPSRARGWRSRTPASISRPRIASASASMMGTALGGIGFAEEQLVRLPAARASSRVSTDARDERLRRRGELQHRDRVRREGPNSTNAMSCASGTIAIGEGFRQIRDGYADVMICGGAEAPLAPLASARSRSSARCRRATTIRRARRARSTATATAS